MFTQPQSCCAHVPSVAALGWERPRAERVAQVAWLHLPLQAPPLLPPLLREADRGFRVMAKLGTDRRRTKRRPGATPSAAAAPSSEPRRRSTAVKQIKASEVCDAGTQISAILGRLADLKASSTALGAAMEDGPASRWPEPAPRAVSRLRRARGSACPVRGAWPAGCTRVPAALGKLSGVRRAQLRHDGAAKSAAAARAAGRAAAAGGRTSYPGEVACLRRARGTLQGSVKTAASRFRCVVVLWLPFYRYIRMCARVNVCVYT